MKKDIFLCFKQSLLQLRQVLRLCFKTAVVLSVFALLTDARMPLHAESKGPVAVVHPEKKGKSFRWGVGYSSLSNVKANFSGLGTFGNAMTLPSLADGVDRNYDDGFVHVDDLGNPGGFTSNWGYKNAAQIDPAGGGTLNLSVYTGLGDVSVATRDKHSPGIEVYGYFEMGEVVASKKSLRWGIKTLANFTDISVSNSQSAFGNASRVVDSYPLNGVVPPLAPYTGPSSGIGPLLGDTPVRANGLAAGGVMVSGTRELDVSMLSFGVGPYLEWRVCERFSIQGEFGLNLALAHGDYSYESTPLIGSVTQSRQGSRSSTSLLPGAHAGLTGTLQLNESFGVFGSARYQYFDSFDIKANGSKADLSFDGTFVVTLGAIFQF